MPLQQNVEHAQMDSQMGSQMASRVLNFVENKQLFEFTNIKEKPVLSILQGYSAPVKLQFERDDEELAFCMAHETDDFNRWEAWQQLSSRLILSLVESINSGGELFLPDYYIDACKKTLNNKRLDKALIARALTLPSLMYVGEMMPVIDVDAIHQAREFIYSHLAHNLKQDLLTTYQQNSQLEYSLSPVSMGERFLRNQALSYLMYLDEQGELLAKQQYQSANNMTDQMAAFKSLLHHETASADEVTEAFYQQWKQDNLVMDKWFTVQATAPYILRHASGKTRVKNLFAHDDFDIKNPNRVRSLLGAFCSANPLCFHDVSGFGYDLLGRYIETLDLINPQIASRLCLPLTRWKRFNETRQQLMKAELQRLISLPKLSKDVSELVEKSLK
jgi:aminopeptidase N